MSDTSYAPVTVIGATEPFVAPVELSAEAANAARHTPEAIQASLDEVDAILVEALHAAWLAAHVARMESGNRSMRSIPAYQRATAAKYQLETVWITLGLPGKIHDVPQRIAS